MTLLKRVTVCRQLGMSSNGLHKLAAKDPTFPRPLKLGETMQSPVYFDSSEIEAWIESKKAARGATA